MVPPVQDVWTRGNETPMSVPMAAPAITSVTKCIPERTRKVAVSTARLASVAAKGTSQGEPEGRSRTANVMLKAAAANAIVACPEGKESFPSHISGTEPVSAAR